MSPEPLPLLPLVLDGVPPGLRQALGQEGVPCLAWQEGPARGRFVLFDSRRAGPRLVDPRQTAIDVDLLRPKMVEDPLAAFSDLRWRRMRWRVGELALVEEVSRVNKRALRRLVLGRLRGLIERAGGVWLRLAAFPFPYRSAFSLRIDYDDFEPSDFDALLRALAGHEDATSHYVNGSAFASVGQDVWRRLAGLDVGSHGYWHHTYRGEEENYRNILRGIETIRGAGIEPSGFVAPHGRYYPELGRAMARLGISHAGEFTLAYDELPFRPGEDDVLQIPVHPVCLGLFLDAARRKTDGTPAAIEARPGAAAQAAGDYFCELAQSRYQAGEPIFLYGHPTGRLGRYPEVLGRLFATVDRLSALWRTTHSQLAAWWRQRAATRVSVEEREDRYEVTIEGGPRRWPLGIEYARGQHVALVPAEGSRLSLAPASLAYERRAAPPSVVPVRIRRPEGLRAQIRRMIDWEQITPLAEIEARGWRNLAKRTLRRWKAA